MPELPEVETVRRGLAPIITGKQILHLQQNRPNLRFPFPVNFAQRLEGRRIIETARRAKYLLLRLDDGWSWLIHLGMSGRFTFTHSDALRSNPSRALSGQAGKSSGWVLAAKHDHILAFLENDITLIYNDSRRFGFMDLIKTNSEQTSSYLTSLGPEPMESGFNPDFLLTTLAAKKTPIKSALLNQNIIAGLGNIYVCEALWRAKIDPKRLSSTLSRKEIEDLVIAINDVISEAIIAGGSSLNDYVKVDGELGYFQHNFQAYDREGMVCVQEKCNGIIQKIVQSGRATFFCPEHQK